MTSDRTEAAKARIAVASNFMKTAKLLVKEFQKQSPHRIILSAGSTGKLYAQIIHGAPFDLFLSADAARPEKLENTPYAVKGTRFTYALGNLILWTSEKNLNHKNHNILKSPDLKKLAIANPRTAPYGAAAIEVLKAMKLDARLKPKLVYGENISQTYQFIATGAVQAGFIAKSQTNAGGGLKNSEKQQYWTVPEEMYAPIRQQAILLTKGQNNPAARAFMNYLKDQNAKAIIKQDGYSLELQ